MPSGPLLAHACAIRALTHSPVTNEDPRGSSYGGKGDGEMAFRVCSQNLGHASSTIALTFPPCRRSFPLVSWRVLSCPVASCRVDVSVNSRTQLRECVREATRCHPCEPASDPPRFSESLPLRLAWPRSSASSVVRVPLVFRGNL